MNPGNRIDEARRSEATILEELRAHGVQVRKANQILCPFHEDHNPSAGIYTAKDGAVRFKCQRCGVCEDVWGLRAKFTKRDRADVIREAIGHSTGHKQASARPKELALKTFPSLEALVSTYSNVEAVYYYERAEDETRIDLAVIRWRETKDGPKRFCQAHHTERGWVPKAPEKPWPLYNRPRLRDSQEVVFCEGEKCVDALARVGIVATTSPAGAGKAEHCDLSPLAGKHVILWPDNDPPDEKGLRTGVAHMRDVQRRLQNVKPRPRISWLDPDGLNLPPKGDAADLVADAEAKFGGDAASVVRETIAMAEPTGPSGELRELLDETIAGRRQCLPMPWPELANRSMALMPGTITLLCGAPGTSKSFMVLDLLRHWVENGVRVTALMLEEHRAWHLNRVLAMVDGNSQLLNPRWVLEHPAEVREAQSRHSEMVEAIGQVMQSAPPAEETSQDQVRAWCENAVHEGAEVIVVDPVTIATRQGQPWQADAQFVAKLTQAVAGTMSRLVLVTHPRSMVGVSTVSLDSVAGGASYQRFSQTILWLQSHPPEQPVMVTRATMFGTDSDEVHPDRVVKILKARNGPGQGSVIAFAFDPRSLRFRELGCIKKGKQTPLT